MTRAFDKKIPALERAAGIGIGHADSPFMAGLFHLVRNIVLRRGRKIEAIEDLLDKKRIGNKDLITKEYLHLPDLWVNRR